jgi:hypothetical protein
MTGELVEGTSAVQVNSATPTPRFQVQWDFSIAVCDVETSEWKLNGNTL